MSLPVLDARIEARASATRAEYPWWPCAEGCDRCCRSLPHLPTITGPEWERLREAIAQLPGDVQAAIAERTASAPASGPLTCPMLDASRGACLVYEARPVACRAYGFYTERDAGLHCDGITVAIEEKGAAGTVVWGNGEALAADMRSFGEIASLRDWMSRRAPARRL